MAACVRKRLHTRTMQTQQCRPPAAPGRDSLKRLTQHWDGSTANSLLRRMPTCRNSTRRAARRACAAASAAGLESEVTAAPAVGSVKRTSGADANIVEFKSDRSHETDVVIVGAGLGGKLLHD